MTTGARSGAVVRPSRRHANIIKSRARLGHDEDQLARALGITRETMRGWAKRDAGFAKALDEALQTSLEYWVQVEQDVHEREQRERELAANAKRFAHMPHRQPDRTALEPTAQSSRQSAVK